MNETTRLFLLEPPYGFVRWLDVHAAPAGSVVIADSVHARPTAAQVRQWLDLVPWCPLVVFTPVGSDQRGVRRTPRAALIPDPTRIEGVDTSDMVVAAVRNRAHPSPSDLVEWLVRRTGLVHLSRLMVALASRPLLTASEVRSLSFAEREQLAELGMWGAIEWQQAFRLASYAAWFGRTERGTLSPLAAPAGVLGGGGLLGIREEEFRGRCGWEWVLEAGVQRSGFFSPEAVERRSAVRRRWTGADVAAWSSDSETALRVGREGRMVATAVSRQSRELRATQGAGMRGGGGVAVFGGEGAR